MVAVGEPSERALELFAGITPQQCEDMLGDLERMHAEVEELRERAKRQGGLRLLGEMIGTVEQIALVRVQQHRQPPEVGAFVYEVDR